MIPLGHFLELSVPAADIPASLNFYRKLGFTEILAAEIRPHLYAVVTDGHVAVGLHGSSIESPSLAFVRPDLDEHVRMLESVGVKMAFSRLGVEEFHEAGLRTPDGHLILLLEARTFSPVPVTEITEPITGRSREISLQCRDVASAAGFWEGAGLITDEQAPDAVRLLAPGIRLGLRRDISWQFPVLRFEPPDLPQLVDFLSEEGMGPAAVPGGFVLTAPEGTFLHLVPPAAPGSGIAP